jgi:hypothetical protein
VLRIRIGKNSKVLAESEKSSDTDLEPDTVRKSKLFRKLDVKDLKVNKMHDFYNAKTFFLFYRFTNTYESIENLSLENCRVKIQY